MHYLHSCLTLTHYSFRLFSLISAATYGLQRPIELRKMWVISTVYQLIAVAKVKNINNDDESDNASGRER